MTTSVSVTAHARLHICLIDMNGSIGRVDGSVGVVLSKPTLRVTAKSASKLNVDKELLPYAQRFFTWTRSTVNVDLKLEECFERHVGLGSTTQLALSVAKSLSVVMGRNHSARQLAAIMGRGGTSGIGVAGFEGGGSLVVDGGHVFGRNGKTLFMPSDYSDAAMPAQPVFKLDLPSDWRFVVVVPRGGKRIYGHTERRLFEEFTPIPDVEVGSVARIILMRLLPAAVERDLDGFGQAIDMLQAVGFKKLELASQPPVVRQTMEEGRRLGAAGAGMSSFGPAVYFLVKGDTRAQALAENLTWLSEKTYVCSPWSGGASVETTA